jgi:hypothetical protein
MVVKGPFEVSLVRADTKEPFQEHENERGETYVEVEPDMDYFIRVKHTYPGDSLVRADFMLDGVGFSSYTILIHGRECLRGLWSVQGDTEIEKALCFHREELGTNTKKIWFGSLEVTFSEAIPQGSQIPQNVTNRWTGGIVDGSIPGTKDKVVKSKEGSLSLIRATPKLRRLYDAGKELAKIKLYYCTTFGLIQAGILAKPPLWEHHSLQHPRREEDLSPPKMTPSMIRCLNVSPERILLTAGNEESGSPEVIVDFFDLTDADNSSVDGDDEQLQNGQPRRKLDFEANI